jgi:hypothetical protein
MIMLHRPRPARQRNVRIETTAQGASFLPTNECSLREVYHDERAR